MPWYALYTKPRNEKKLTGLLQSKGISAYCPLQETLKQWSDRRKKVKEPLIRSYVFVQLEDYEKDSAAALETPGAVRFLWWLKKPAVVRDEEIARLRALLEEKGGDYEVESLQNLEPGDRVKIVQGLWQENEGYLLRKEDKRVVLLIESLETVITVNVPKPQVRPL
ncbi:transcription antitermination protein nusG [Anseongella ginsenosidimutans]|uniref:Transcription antitermination protein nusG n=1 Tax=Anseongella ginsenosidimutans TaxID=496056 RepID=A0A4R3KLT4_9SPHI|nr:UpxY family transcription antiterminator [Anseongella ginsenosidimutans]QEC52129.1 UpxY family transcription antiterminator [Anseongella ginsenosidimutans]TCS84842.1 transcription antitermination protein nusG [Anseongella ginsenosidimutans]